MPDQILSAPLCQVKFRLKKGLESDTIVSGRKQNKTMVGVFLQTCDWLEEQVCIQWLRDFNHCSHSLW